MSDFLSPATLHALTGTPQKARQIAWLLRYGWLYSVDQFGRPRVAQAYYDRRMVGVESPAPKGETMPNWKAIGA